MTRWIGSLVLLTIAAPAFGQNPRAVPDIPFKQRLDEQVPLDLIFRDESGAAVSLGKYFGDRPVILVLAYYRCPRLCSLVLNTLSNSMRKLDYRVGKEFVVVTVSIDPRETAELAAAKKASYIEHYGDPEAAQGWHFLTGDESAIQALAAAVGFGYAYDAKHDQYAHSSGIMVLTPDGRVARYFYGISYPARSLRYGLEDASAGKIGAPVASPVRLLCFTYDPTTGTYTLMTLRLVRVAGVVTLIGLGIFVTWQWRAGSRQRPAPSLTNEGPRAPRPRSPARALRSEPCSTTCRFFPSRPRRSPARSTFCSSSCWA